ncbi:unnamed protein product [Rangifer tarandus platyrhynchus]|uniref:Uncharacterized protein n=2 Tax=Rangifer tarandus platyrhynchus TaxID=3082113 RepID=A0ABN8ZJM6_RANTA|nr:unnamed protein product [Rangifer tarandus platyrhynchus]
MLLKLGPFSNTLTYTLILLFKNSSASILPGGLGCFKLLRHVKAGFSLNALVPRKAVGWNTRAANSLQLKGHGDLSLCLGRVSSAFVLCSLKNAHSSFQV